MDNLKEADSIRTWVSRDMQQIQSDICSNNYDVQSVDETLQTFYASLDNIEKKLLQCRMRCDESVCIMDFLHLNMRQGGATRGKSNAAAAGDVEGDELSEVASLQISGPRNYNFFSLLTFQKVAKERREGFLIKKSTSADAKYYRRYQSDRRKKQYFYFSIYE